MQPIEGFTDRNFISICEELAIKDPDLQAIIVQYGYPPLWKRGATFETLVHIILEQQVSLASAKSALNKLKEKIGDITPVALLALTEPELKSCYFSRQKIIYTKHLANAIVNNELKMGELAFMENDLVRSTLTKIKGIGNWTVDVYLMMVLQRSDLFPLGDVALMTSVKEVKKLPRNTSSEKIAAIAAAWRPHQTIASFLLWHSYLCRRKRQSYE